MDRQPPWQCQTPLTQHPLESGHAVQSPHHYNIIYLTSSGLLYTRVQGTEAYPPPPQTAPHFLATYVMQLFEVRIITFST